MDLLRERLVNQKLAGSTVRDPGEVVSWFGAVQAQDLPGAKWAVGLRGEGLTEASVERAYDEGAILRTHVLRPTWHFVAAPDIRWLIALTGPRVISRLGPRHRYLEIDDKTVVRSRSALTRALDQGPLTRRQVGEVFRRARIPITPERFTHLMVLAELEGLVCSGPMRGGQTTYALMDHRVPAAPPVERDEALARLAARYFLSHGPAAVADFAWWSGLPVGDARAAIDMAGTAVPRDAVIAKGSSGRARSRTSGTAAWLLPNFDEFLVAYKDRSAVLGRVPIDPRDTLTHTVLIEGRAVGSWKAGRQARLSRAAAAARHTVSITVAPRVKLTRADWACIRQAADRYARFLGAEVTVGEGL